MLMGPELPQLLFIHIIVSINNYGHRSTPVIIGQHIWPTHPSIGQHLRPSTKSFGHRGISSVIGWRRPTRTPPVCICLDRHYFILLFIHLNGGECETNITSINNTSKLDGGYYLLDPGVWSLPRISGKYGERIARPNNIIHNIYIIYTPPSISLSQVMGYTHSQHAPLQQLSITFITLHIWMRIPLIETFTKPNANKLKLNINKTNVTKPNTNKHKCQQTYTHHIHYIYTRPSISSSHAWPEGFRWRSYPCDLFSLIMWFFFMLFRSHNIKQLYINI